MTASALTASMPQNGRGSQADSHDGSHDGALTASMPQHGGGSHINSLAGSHAAAMAAARPEALQGFAAVCFDSLDQVRAEWAAAAAAGAGSPFQQLRWIEAWYAACAERQGVTPLIIRIADRATGQLAAILPLIRVKQGSLTAIEFADLGITDYNAPLLGPAAPQTPAGAARLWQSLRAALPPADLLRFEKMPRTLRGRVNPLTLLQGVTEADLTGNAFEVHTTWLEWRASLGRTFRKEIERSWRVFNSHPGAAFRRISDPAEAQRILAEIERLQRERINGMGLTYILDDRPNAAVYRRLVRDGLGDGSAVLTTMTVGDEVAAALLGLADRKSYAMIRLAIGGPRWKNCSPGRLILDGSMALMREAGITHFDFTIGDYPFKRRLGAAAVPLAECIEALSWRGRPVVAKQQLRRWLKRQDWLRNAVRAMRGKGKSAAAKPDANPASG